MAESLPERVQASVGGAEWGAEGLEREEGCLSHRRQRGMHVVMRAAQVRRSAAGLGGHVGAVTGLTTCVRRYTGKPQSEVVVRRTWGQEQ